jgi:hypothetical protein
MSSATVLPSQPAPDFSGIVDGLERCRHSDFKKKRAAGAARFFDF